MTTFYGNIKVVNSDIIFEKSDASGNVVSSDNFSSVVASELNKSISSGGAVFLNASNTKRGVVLLSNSSSTPSNEPLSLVSSVPAPITDPIQGIFDVCYNDITGKYYMAITTTDFRRVSNGWSLMIYDPNDPVFVKPSLLSKTSTLIQEPIPHYPRFEEFVHLAFDSIHNVLYSASSNSLAAFDPSTGEFLGRVFDHYVDKFNLNIDSICYDLKRDIIYAVTGDDGFKKLHRINHKDSNIGIVGFLADLPDFANQPIQLFNSVTDEVFRAMSDAEVESLGVKHASIDYDVNSDVILYSDSYLGAHRIYKINPDTFSIDLIYETGVPFPAVSFPITTTREIAYNPTRGELMVFNSTFKIIHGAPKSVVTLPPAAPPVILTPPGSAPPPPLPITPPPQTPGLLHIPTNTPFSNALAAIGATSGFIKTPGNFKSKASPLGNFNNNLIFQLDSNAYSFNPTWFLSVRFDGQFNTATADHFLFKDASHQGDIVNQTGAEGPPGFGINAVIAFNFSFNDMRGMIPASQDGWDTAIDNNTPGGLFPNLRIYRRIDLIDTNPQELIWSSDDVGGLAKNAGWWPQASIDSMPFNDFINGLLILYNAQLAAYVPAPPPPPPNLPPSRPTIPQ